MGQEDGVFATSREPAPFANLVALHVRWPGNRLDDSFPLNVILEVGEDDLVITLEPRLIQRIRRKLFGELPTQDLHLRIRLRHCHVRYHSDAIEIVAASKYESMTLEGNFQTKMLEKSHAATKAHIDARLGGGGELKATGPDASLLVKIGAGFNREHDRTIEATTAATPDIYEVRAVPGGWRVGDPEYGDPNKEAGCLDGPYFNRSVSGFPHTCRAEFRDGRDRGTLTFAVTVRDGLHVKRIGGGGPSSREGTAAVALMRDRIAALRLETSLRHSGNAVTKRGEEMPVETITCEVVRAADEEATEPSIIRPAPARRARRRSAP